jgi:hypothetical protein
MTSVERTVVAMIPFDLIPHHFAALSNPSFEMLVSTARNDA